ncbi:MAG: PKD domain-containing protein [Acidobacteriota bacterium]
MVPSALWGELEPVSIAGDNTAFNEFLQPYGTANPFWVGVDVDSGYLYAAISHGIQVLDLHTNPASPTVNKVVDGPSTLRFWPLGEVKQPLRGIDVEGSLGGIVGQAGIGTAIFDFTNPIGPRLLYQDSAYDGSQIYATTIGAKKYAFSAAATGVRTGVAIYNMTVASGFSACLQNTGACPGVFLGVIGNGAAYVHGAGNYVAFSSLSSTQIWDVSNPAAPIGPRMSAFAFPSSAYGLAMWQVGGTYYLGMRTGTEGRIYDVSCIASGLGCTSGSPGTLIWSQAMPGGTPELTVTYSTSGSRRFLYFGNDNKCGSGPPDAQREFLIDVTNPASAHDITPPTTVLVQNSGGVAQPTGYWNWYYRRNPSGFNQVMPRNGKFYNEYFYRAAFSMMDVHKLAGGVAPTANFSWSPTEIYPGTPVSFTDLSSGAPTSWSWTFAPDGSPSSAVSRNPANITFAAMGTKAVGLTATNTVGPSLLKTQQVPVLDPAPAIAAVNISPTNPVVCQPVTFSATGVTGKPALGYSWNVATNPGGQSAASSTSPGFTWVTNSSTTPGGYSSTLQVQNTSGTATKSINFTLGSLAMLPAGGTFTPSNDSFSAGTVQFHVAVAGATEWNWDFGDGAGFTGWTNDPVAGPNPTRSYTTTGNKSVVVQIRNCVELARSSSTLTVNISQLTPLVAGFQAQCGIFGCDATVGTPLVFTDTSSGGPDHWDYDWDGNGTYEDAGHTTPVTVHTYVVAGSYHPKLLVHRGAETASFTHSNIVVDSGGPSASITISGSSTVNINTALVLTGIPASCSASATGWTWSVGTGSITGPANTSAISVKWTTVGTKSVSVTNTGCTGASGSKSVTVTDPNTNPGTLAAAFTVTPASPAIAQSVTFDGSSSTGAPTGYSWDFGDGQNATGVTATHAYATAGTYTLRLTVTKPGTGVFCPGGTCSAEKAQPVIVGATPPIQVDFTTSAPCTNQFGLLTCSGNAGAAINFVATGVGATSFTWSFGDGSPNATGGTVSHAFGESGSFTVTVTGTDGHTSQIKSRVFQIDGATFPLDYTTSATCSSPLGIESCNGHTGSAIDFTAVSASATSYGWSFGDGTPDTTGGTARHTFANPGSYQVMLTASDGHTNASKSRSFVITGVPVPPSRSVIVPWVGQTPAPAQQTSDLFINNPGTVDLPVTITFRKRGVPDTNPPKVTRTVPARGTLLVTDVLGQLFTQPNTGFLVVTVDGIQQLPVVAEINTTTSSTGARLTQSIPGLPLDSSNSQSTGQKLHLVGLSDGPDSNSAVGISNGGGGRADVRLEFFGADGSPLSTSDPIVLAGSSQKQLTLQQLRGTFSVGSQRDYRVEIESLTDGQVFTFGAGRSSTTADPSFLRSRPANSPKSYLLGVFDTSANTTSRWQSDLVIANPADAAQSAVLTFVANGVGAPSAPVTINLAAGETKRLVNVLGTTFNATNKTGMVISQAAGSAGTYPVLSAQSYDNTTPTRRYGETVESFTESEAAGQGHHMVLLGLRQSTAYDSVFWVAGVGSATAVYDIIFRDFQGNQLLKIANKRVGPGRLKQYPGSAVANAPNGLFSVDIVVRAGQIIAAGKVTTLSSKDPAYIKGQAY